MKRTINEKRALNIIIFSFLVNYVSVALIILSMKLSAIFLSILGISGFFYGSASLFYGGYSLGWEYKRISMEDSK